MQSIRIEIVAKGKHLSLPRNTLVAETIAAGEEAVELGSLWDVYGSGI